ncbi:AAA family ATPase [Botrimarina mediterranea]|nr:hypothetical protein [Botrimarina mediterranea]
MNAWIIAENDAVTSRIEEALRRQGHLCPAGSRVRLEALPSELDQLAVAKELVFFVVNRITPAHLESMRAVRTVIDDNALLVVVSGAADHATVLGAVRVGANDFLTINDQLEEELSRLFSRVHLTRRGRADKGYTVTVLPCQSSPDANVVAVNLAAAFASRATSCGLLDFHFRGGDLALLLKQTPRHTVIDLLTQRDAIDEPMLRQVVTAHDSGIQLLAGPTSLSDLTAIRPQTCEEVIALSQQMWPAVVINAEDALHAEQMRALSLSDDIVLAARLDIPSLHRADRQVEMLVEHQVARERVHMVVLGAGLAGEIPASAVKKVLQIAELRSIPDDPVALLRSVNLGNPLVLEQPGSKAAVALRQFAESLLSGPRSAGEAKPLTTFKAAATLAASAIPFCR